MPPVLTGFLRRPGGSAEPQRHRAAEAQDTAGGVVPSLAVFWAGAVRAKRVAKPTAVTALSWVARQVSRDSRYIEHDLSELLAAARRRQPTSVTS